MLLMILILFVDVVNDIVVNSFYFESESSYEFRLLEYHLDLHNQKDGEMAV